MRLLKINNKKDWYKNSESGVAMMIALMFFVAISVLIIFGLTGPTAREYRIASNAMTSRQSYFVAESGVEDVYYRVKNAKAVLSPEALSIGGATTLTTINTSGGITDIKSVGSKSSLQRSVDLKVDTASTVSFYYGAESGVGGLNMSGGSSTHVNGAVFANGPITGDYSTYISSNAVSATSDPLSVDQSNGIDTPSNDINFGDATSSEDIAESFILGGVNPLNKVSFYVKKTGVPADATVSILNDAGGVPGSIVYAKGTMIASSVTNTYGWVDVTVSPNAIISNIKTYWLVINVPSHSVSDFYTIGASGNTYSNGIPFLGQYPSSWHATTPASLDYFFKIYTGGFIGSIHGNSGTFMSPVNIGTSGVYDARAHSVTYTNATGNIYCSTGTGNNKACTSAPDVPVRNYTVDDTLITTWQNDAAAGIVSTGDFSVGPSGGFISGAKEINGNVTIANGTLTIGGTLWIRGNLTIMTSGHIKLSSTYGAHSGVVIVDGTINVNSGGTIMGSSGVTPGSTSYLMLVGLNSTSSAATVTGGTNYNAIYYIPNGTLNVSSTTIQQASAYKIQLGAGGAVSYNANLGSIDFLSGGTTTTATYNINSWQEAQ